MVLLSFCSFPWWLYWLLPFLLGLALGWALWSKYKGMVANLENDVSNLNGKVLNLESDIKTNHHTIAELEGDISIAKGKLREAENALADCLDSGNGSKNKGKKSGKGSGKSNKSDDSSKSDSDASSSTLGGSGNSGTDMGVASLASSGGSGSSTSNISSSGSSSESKGSSGGSKSGIYAGLSSDNLQIIEGIGPKMEEVLKDNGVDSWAALAGKSESDLRALLNTYGDKYKIIDVATWQAQAKFAANGDFDGLISMQKNIDGGNANTLSKSDSKLEKYLIKKGVLKAFVQDDLKAIEGIGPKISELLQNAGINTWRDLANSSSDEIKSILDAAGSRFKLADPGTWPRQASLAADGKFDELRAYQDELQGGR